MKKFITAAIFALAALPSAAALTDPQQATLAAHVRANTDPVVVSALAQRNDSALAQHYNGASTCIVWRSNVPPSEYREAIVWTAVDGLTNGKARIWEWITQGMTAPIDGTKANIRQGIADAWGAASATGVALQAVAKRPASRAENLWTSGACTTANPALMTWEGPLQVNDLSDALNKY